MCGRALLGMAAGGLGQLLSCGSVRQGAAWHGCWRAGSAVELQECTAGHCWAWLLAGWVSCGAARVCGRALLGMAAGGLGQLLSCESVRQGAAWHGCWWAGSAVELRECAAGRCLVRSWRAGSAVKM